jgi:hypothetical protein
MYAFVSTNNYYFIYALFSQLLVLSCSFSLLHFVIRRRTLSQFHFCTIFS